MADGPAGEPSISEVSLIGCAPEHATQWHKWRAEDRSRRHNPLVPLSVAELAVRLADVGQDVTDERRTHFRWMVGRQGEVVGTVSLSEVSWQCGYGTLGITIGEAHQGQGIASRALAQLVDHVFSTSRLHRLIATVSVDNDASRRLFQKTGFSQEGLLREHFLIEGRRVDQWLFGMLRSEWATLSTAKPLC